MGLSDGIQANLLTLLMETEAQGEQASGCEGNEKEQALRLRPGFNSPLGPSLVLLGNYLTPFSPVSYPFRQPLQGPSEAGNMESQACSSCSVDASSLPSCPRIASKHKCAFICFEFCSLLLPKMEEEEAQPPLPHCCLRTLRKFLSQVSFSVLSHGVILQCCGQVGKARMQAPLPLQPRCLPSQILLRRGSSEGGLRAHWIH